MPPDAPRASAAPTEAALLECEAAQARAALRGAIEDLKQSLRHAADPRVWTEKHPWAGVGLAAAAGFGAAALIKEAAAEAVAPAAVTSAPAAAQNAAAPEQPAAQAPPAGHSALHSLLTPLWDIAQAALKSFAVNAVKSSMTSPVAEDLASSPNDAAECAACDTTEAAGLHPRAD